jgi:integrase
VLRYTGLRVSEAMNLTWTDLDLQTRTLHIRSSNAKEGQGRVIPMSPHLVREIAGWGTRLGYLIPSGRCSGVRHRQVRARDFQRAWQRAGVRREV